MAHTTKIRRHSLDLLRHVQHAWMETPERETLLPSVLDALQDAVGADLSSILIVAPDGKELVEQVRAGKKRPTGNERRIRIAIEGITGWVAASGQSAIVKDVRKDKRYLPTEESIRSEAAVPIKIGDRLVGVLNFESSRLAHFDDTDLEWLHLAAQQIALALQSDELRARENRWAEHFALLSHLSRVGFGVIPPRLYLRRVVDSVRAHFGCHYVAVFLGDYEREEVILLAQACEGTCKVPIGMRQKFGAGVIGKAFRVGETVNVRDVRNDPLYVDAIEGVRSEACVPIRMGDRCLGIVDVQARTVGAFEQDEVMFLETLGRWMVPTLQLLTPAEAAKWAALR